MNFLYEVFDKLTGNAFGPGCPWFDWYEKFGPPNLKYCEERICSWINEPANAWSNLAFAMTAIYIYLYSSKNKIAVGKAFGFFIFIMGALSFWYHASNNYLTQIFDFIGMYFYVYLLLVLNLFRMKKVSEEKIVPVFLFFVAVGTILIPVFRAISLPYQLIVAFSAVAILMTEIKLQKAAKKAGNIWPCGSLWFAVLFFIAGEVSSLVDMKRLYCDPTNHYLQGHSFMHIFSAVGVYFSFVYYRQFLSKKN